jgi:protein pelota
LIVTEFSPRHGRCSLIIESAEDLWTLRRVISKGDVVVTRSSRVVKNEGEYSRPDRGERVKVTLALSVESIRLDSSVERIRVRGTIVEASDDSVSKVGSHAVTLSPGHTVTIRKERWTPLEEKLVRSSARISRRFIVVAADRREAGIGLLSGSHLSVVANVESGLGGKMSAEQSTAPYIAKVVEAVARTVKEGDELVLAGPGNFKNAIGNGIRGGLKSLRVWPIEGFDMTGPDGVRLLVKNPAFQEVTKDSALVELQKLVSEAVKRISKGDPKVAYTLARVRPAAEAGAVESCAVSDDVFSSAADEEALVGTLNSVEEKGGSVWLADSSLEFGKQVAAFGGVVALLRYPFKAS